MLCAVCNCQNADNATVCRSCGSPLATGSAGTPSTAGLQAGTKLNNGKFTVGKVLGQGGFGITYLGGDASLGRSVAIKEFFPQGCIRQGTTVCPSSAITVTDYHVARQKFLEEARVLAQFHHRGIVAVYSTFEENNTAYMVMEFVKGKTLLSLVETRGPLPEKEVVNYITQAADALNAVHEAKLLHRDIKPENLMVTQDGRVVLVDFGTARAFASGKTRRMTAMLTPGYAPLEQYGQQARFGVFTDLYALGATCYHLLTGQMPVQATDRAAGVELQPPHRLNHAVSQTVSDAVMWAMEMRADRRPQSAQEFVKALKGEMVQADRGKADNAPSPSGERGNPYESRMMQLAAELKKPPAPAPPSTHDARIADISPKLALCASYRVQEPNRCPGCGNASLEEVTGRFTGNCPVCRTGKLMKRKLDFDKCPICRNGQLGQQKLERPLIFCPICRMRPLEEDRRKRFGIRIDLWWVCPNCKAEIDVADLQQEWAKLERYEQDPFGVGAKYVGQKLTTLFWLSISPQCNLTRKCGTCGAAFYEFPDASMMLMQYSTDPHGVGKQTLGQCLPRLTWARLAHNLSPNMGNACCSQCRAEFDFNKTAATLNLLSCNAGQFKWADELKGQPLPIATWCLLGDGKRSSHPGWLCKQCSTEFDIEETGLRLVGSSAQALSQNVGSVLPIVDWQRLGAGVPTTAQEYALNKELTNLQAAKQQEESAFRRREQERLAALKAELATLVKKSVLGGFIPIPTGWAEVRLGDGEMLCWDSSAHKFKRRSRQGESYWEWDDQGRLLVTTDRIVFVNPDDKRWQRPLAKMFTPRVEELRLPYDDGKARSLGYPSNVVTILILGFDGLQNPLAFFVGDVEVTATINDYQYTVTLTVTDLVEMLCQFCQGDTLQGQTNSRCPKCGFSLSWDGTKCSHCHYSASQTSPSCPRCGFSTSWDGNQCARCKYPANTRCPLCGFDYAWNGIRCGHCHYSERR
jgi:serine/threonine protein kinase